MIYAGYPAIGNVEFNEVFEIEEILEEC